MKKFLIFLVAIISTVCIGVTFYQFAKNDEVIKFNTQTVYINYGDKLSLDDLGFSRKEINKQTKIDFNAGGDEVTSIIKYDAVTNSYIPTSKGGATTIKITTTNRKYKSFNIDVFVGVGSEEFPYYISNEQQLFDVTNAHIDDEACFKIVNDINLTQTHTPIGLIDNKYREFTGKLNGDYHTISNLQLESCDYAGLIAIMGATSEVYNLNIENANIEGEFINVGAIAGKCYGTINKVIVSNANIVNAKEGGNTGAVVGLLETDSINSVPASILRTFAYTDQNKVISAKGNLGGLAGQIKSANIRACHTSLNLINTSTYATGGLVGNLMVDSNTYIYESYSISNIQTENIAGNIAGEIVLNENTTLNDITKELVLVGLYYDNTLNNFAGVGSDLNSISTTTTFAINGKSTTAMKIKDTYIYYITTENDIIYWDKVWYLVDGSYPTLTFTTTFNDIELDTEQNATNPDISNPETPNATAVVISNKQQLLDIFQSAATVSGNYILNANIDLEGIVWTPVNFSGTFKSSEKCNYTISNFTIVDNDFKYVGFFSTLTNATISNITFNNITLTTNKTVETAAIVVGHIRGNVIIDNVDAISVSISASTKYAGGFAGYVSGIAKLNKCNIQTLTINETALNVGGIVGYSSSDCYVISCKLKNVNNLYGVDRIGGISAVNYGTIYDCSVNGNIVSSETSSAGYFGGLVGVNYGEVIACSTFAEISVTNNSSETQYYVGGLGGYNLGNFTECSAYADNYSVNTSSGIVYIAGLTGYNSGNLKLCVADVLQIGSVNKHIYVAGLSVFNYGGNIYGCFAFADLAGEQVSGLVRTNTNEGTIDSCVVGKNETSRATYSGVYITSFAYEISSGTISNSLVNANLNCTNNDGWMAGFAGFMPCNKDKFGTISYSIANISFGGVGTKYLEIAGEGLMKSKRTTGTITNCIISSDANTADVVVSEYTKAIRGNKKPGSESNYVIATTEQLKQIETYTNPNTTNFDISAGLNSYKWLYINGSYPIPRTYLEVFGSDIL